MFIFSVRLYRGGRELGQIWSQPVPSEVAHALEQLVDILGDVYEIEAEPKVKHVSSTQIHDGTSWPSFEDHGVVWSYSAEFEQE
jgi:hypothetical protein